MFAADTTKPVITIQGSNPITLFLNNSYSDAGATATDNLDSSVTVYSTSTVDTLRVGRYDVVYTATDLAGNTATKTRAVNVTVNLVPIISLLLDSDEEIDPNADTTPPVVTLYGDNPITILKGSAYSDLGASAYDAVDGTLSVTYDDSIVNTNIGNEASHAYYIQFSAKDAANNIGTATRTVNVINDTTAPVITLNGAASVTIEAGSTYSDAGAIAVDNFDSAVTVITTNSIDTASVLSQQLNYEATDASNNMATAFRSVHIVDTTAPVIVSDSISIEAGSDYSDQAVITSDNSNGVISLSRNSLVNTATVGSTSVSYTATDPSGNSSDKNVTVNVVDTTKPEVIIAGDNPVTIEVGGLYVDAGVVTDDNSNGNIAVTVISSNVNTSVVANGYQVVYRATDAAGNISNTKTRIVNVVDTTAPVISLTGRNPVAMLKDTAYTEAGATATDNSNTSVAVTPDSSAVNMGVAGTYAVSYTAVDPSGNSSSIDRTVEVVTADTEAPVITLNGPSTIQVFENSIYTDAGAIAVDSFEGDIAVIFDHSSITVPALPASPTFSWNFTATDSLGNTSTSTRTIEVIKKDTIAPFISINGQNPITVNANSTYTDAGATAIDAQDGEVAVTVVSSNVNTAVVSNGYQVVYEATDAAGNSWQTARTVNVVSAPYSATPSGQWHLDENTGTIVNDTSGNNNNLTANNLLSNSWYSAGQSGSAINLVETNVQDVSIETLSNINILQSASVTLSAWIKPSSSPSINTRDWEWIAAQGDNYGLYVFPQTRQLVFYKRDFRAPSSANANDGIDDWSGANSDEYILPSSQWYDHWHHVAGTFDATTKTMKIYLDGIEVGSAISQETITYDQGNGFTIGSMQGNRLFNGVIDEVNVYDSAHPPAEINYYMSRTAVDTQKPIITLNGSDIVNVVLGSEYSDLGATAVDNIDGVLTISDDAAFMVDTSILDSYTVSYLATDSSGNTAKAIRIVNVITQDSTAPVITLNGTDPTTIALDTTYNDLGATATDDVDITVAVVETSNVMTSITGVYAVSYTATDAAGNITKATRKVIVSANPAVDESVFTGTYDGADQPIKGQRGSIAFLDTLSNPADDQGEVAAWLTESTGQTTVVNTDQAFTAALQSAQPGDRIQLESGVYKMQPIQISGSEHNPITIESVPGQWAVFDGSLAGSAAAIYVTDTAWLNFRRFEIKNGSIGSIYTRKSHHHLYEGLKIHNNNRGFDLTDGSSFVMIRYNESYHNYELSSNGQNGDGFGIWSENNAPIGEGVILEHNIAWGNADDGIDMWMNGTTVTMRYNISRNNGYNVPDDPNFVGNGNGYKLGPEGPNGIGNPGHFLIKNIADHNPTRGFDYNGGTVQHHLKSNEATNNICDYYVPHVSLFDANINTSGGVSSNTTCTD